VIGIGINVHQQRFPDELRDLATSLFIETGRDWPRQELLIALLQSLHREVTALVSPASAPHAAASILERLEAGSTWIRGKQVRVEEGEGFSGVTSGLDARGFLQVRVKNGSSMGDELRTVFSGGVREG
jgi:BirA family biotin operon repressor/biotin-[acetyl-CoA-carboxylase] ligase